ncbi:biopolymer transporter ExbD, partial [Akkermansiaceae bacterium]|nr:biopolymer transporter ExbD [Akkermansiaceae bacterium]
MLITRKRRIDAGIDMTPLIDVVFQLLIFLMVSSQFIKPDRRVELPAGPMESATSNPDDQHLTLIITAENTILLEGAEIAKEDLDSKLRDAIKHSGIDALVLRVDKAAQAEIIFPVMEIARESGIINLAY